jgi:hypothetical protein
MVVAPHRPREAAEILAAGEVGLVGGWLFFDDVIVSCLVGLRLIVREIGLCGTI